MGSEAIILAGGLGTRLRSVVADLPKCMAPVAGKPFLHYVIAYLQNQGVDKFIFSLGYKHEAITEWLQQSYPRLKREYLIEHEPLGTGGAIQLACQEAKEKNVFVLNGDTLFDADLNKLAAFHESHKADCTLALKPMHDFDRYGVVAIDAENAITSFHEKKHYDKGLINGGIYVLNREKFSREVLPVKFSFEKDYLEAFTGQRKFYALEQDKYFIDIGIPEDFERAQKELKMYN